MILASVAVKVVAGLALTVSSPMVTSPVNSNDTTYGAAKPTCVAGVTKAGKTPISLVPGAKVSCYNIRKAAKGAKLMKTDQNNTCYVCHAAGGVAPFTSTNSNLRTQGYTLKPSSIMEAFNAHVDEMAGATLTNAQAGLLSAYLQSIR